MTATTPGRFTLDDLIALIEARALATADRSYTRTLLDSGMPRIAKKFGEEAVEIVIAAVGGKKGEIVAEAADVIYHSSSCCRRRRASRPSGGGVGPTDAPVGS